MDNQTQYNQYGNNDDTINIRELFQKCLRKWHWFVLATIIAFFAAFIYIKSSEMKYQVQTVILLRNDNSSLGISQMSMIESFGFNGISKEVEDEIQVISSKNIIRQVIDSLEIQVDYFEKNGLKYVKKYKNEPFKVNLSKDFLDTLKYTINIYVKEKGGNYTIEVEARKRFKEKYKLKNIQEPFETPAGVLSFMANTRPAEGAKYKITIHPVKKLVENYSNRLSVGTVNKQSNAIKISIVDSNRNMAEDFLNKMVELYNLDAINDKNIIAKNTANFINERLEIITRELFDVESDVETYKRSHKLTDLSSEAALYLENASAYDKRLTELETQLNMVNSVESYIKNAENADALIPANVITNDPSLAKSIEDYNMAILQKMKLSHAANDKNPALIQTDKQIAALKANVLASVGSVKSGIQIAKNDVLKQGVQFSSKIKSVPTQERQFLEIKRQQEIKQNLYLFLSQRREETALSLASTAPAARTIDKAYASLEPVSPKQKMIYLVALMFGLFVPFLFIYLKDLIYNKVEDPKEFQRMIKAPYLGSVGISREGSAVVVADGKTTPIAEMFRLIRANLQFIVGGKKSPVMLVTSSLAGEGKSFVSINLAMSLALTNKKVLVMGMDIRSPMLGEYLDLSNRNKGMTVYLSDSSVDPKEIIHPSGWHDCLDVVPAGPVPPNPAELLMSPRLDAFIAYAKEKYDYIVVDTAPIGMVSDTYHLNRITDISIFVARQNYTPKDAVALINEIYKENRLQGVGVVLNGASLTSGYGYGYGYYYNGNQQRRYKLPRITFDEKLRSYIYDFLKKRRSHKQ